MTDIVTYCDVNTCEDCPRYGDDCDGDKGVEHTDTISRADAMGAVQDHFNADGFKGYDDGQKMMDRINALPSADAVPQLKQTDTLIIADALRYLAKDTERHLADRTRADALRQQFLKYGASMCHSAEAKPTVIRSKTLLPTKDFKEWAKRVRETNPNVIVIPCDAEVVSADAVQGWIPFTRRPMTEEEQKDYPNCTFMFDCVLPDDGDEILVSNGRFVWMDVFCNDIDGCYLDGGDDIDEDMAWMPLPKPYKGGDDK
jgi:hypothetical protein